MSNNMTGVTALIDGQWGSTGKGVIAAHIANMFDVHVRVGAPNAGHSFFWDGIKTVRQSIPVGHINPKAKIVIGRGALINMDILRREYDEIYEKDWSIQGRLFVDAYAGIISPWHVEAEGHTQGELHQRIGSTGEGVGASRIDRVRRDPEKFKRFVNVYVESEMAHLLCWDTPRTIRNWRELGLRVMLEGSQGNGLDLIHGDWPYVTSNGCGAAQLAADVGIPPQHVDTVIMVCRTHPIRVHGNSGPLPKEITWEQLSNRLGKEVVEKTTVTKKVRRIAEWSDDVIEKAITLNAPTHLAITFLDYINPNDEGVDEFEKLSKESRMFLERIENRWNTPIAFLGTGGPNWKVINHEVPSWMDALTAAAAD